MYHACFLALRHTSWFPLCYDQGQEASRAISVCSEVLQSDAENVNVLKDRAEAYIQDEQYEEGKPVRCSWMENHFQMSCRHYVPHAEPVPQITEYLQYFFNFIE